MKLSDGNKMRLYLAAILARNTKFLILDEPASALDPLMRDMLCDMFREYLAEDEERSILFSTHNIADMEYATDYAVFMANGKIVEKGFVEELKENMLWCMARQTFFQRFLTDLFHIPSIRQCLRALHLQKIDHSLKNMILQ